MTRRRTAGKTAGPEALSIAKRAPGSWRELVRGAALVLGIGVATALTGAIFAQAQPEKPLAAVATKAVAVTPAAGAPDEKLLASLATPPGRDAFIKTYCVTCHSARLKTA